MSIPVAKLPHREVIQIRDAAALDAFPRAQAGILTAFSVQIVLEFIIHALAVGLGEASLGFVVSISKVVTLAAGQKIVPAGFIGRVGAAVVGPDQVGWSSGGFGGVEGGQGVGVEEGIGLRDAGGGGAGAGEEIGKREREGEGGGDEAEEEEGSVHFGSSGGGKLTKRWIEVVDDAMESL